MRNLIRFIGVRHLRQKWVRSLLVAAGVATGVTLFVSIHILNRSARAAFRDNVEAVAGTAALVVSAGEAAFPEDRLEIVEATPGVKHAVPMTQNVAHYGVGDGGTETLLVLGVDLLKEQSVRTYKTSDQRVLDDPLVFLNQPDSIIITHAFARKHGLGLESQLTLTTSRGPRRVTVRGLLSPEGPARAYGGALAIMDIDAARLMFGSEGRTDRIDVVPAPGAALPDVEARLRAALGPGFEIERPSAQADGMERLVESYQATMNFFSSLALLVGAFLVGNAMNVSVVERRREIGTLRALGAERWQIAGLFLIEALLLGAIGGLAGAWLGRLLAMLMREASMASLSTQLLAPVDVTRLQFEAGDVVRALIIGVVVSAVAAVWPAYRTTRVQPVEALRLRGAEGAPRRARLSRLGATAGTAILIYVALSSRWGWSSSSASWRHLTDVGGVIGAALLGPAAVSLLLRGLRPLFIALGASAPVLRLALENLLNNRRRTAANVLVLMVGFVLVIMIGSVSRSFQATAADWTDRVLDGDLFVSSAGSMISLQGQPLHEDVGRALEKVPGIWVRSGRAAYGMRFTHLTHQGARIALKAFDQPDPATGYRLFDVRDGTSAQAAKALFEPGSPPSVLVSENYVRRFGKKTGDVIDLSSPTGVLHARIAAVVADFASNVGVIYISRALYVEHWRDHLVTMFSVYAAPGTTPEQLREAIDRTLGQSLNLAVASSLDLKRDLSLIIEKSFADSRAIEAAALLVGLLSLLNTLLVSVMERTRELGMLRAIGMSRGQLHRMILSEAVLQGGLGAVVAATLGTWMAANWIRGSLADLLGWIVDFHVPWSSLMVVLAAGLLVSALAGLYPAWRAGRIQVKEAIEYE